MPEEKFYLWSFYVNGRVICTRGTTQYNALQHVCKCVPRGQAVALLDHNQIESSSFYSKTHPFDWLKTPPEHLKGR